MVTKEKTEKATTPKSRVNVKPPDIPEGTVTVCPPVIAPPSFDTMYGNTDKEEVTAQQAIRRFCWDCMGGHDEVLLEDGQKLKAYRPYKEVKGCDSKSCWLYPYRTGRKSNKK